MNDRQVELDNVRDELRKHLENLKSLSQFLDKIQRLLPKEIVPHAKEEADKMAKQIKVSSLLCITGNCLEIFSDNSHR